MNVVVCTYTFKMISVSYNNIFLITFVCIINKVAARDDVRFINILEKEYRPMKQYLYFLENKINRQFETVDLELYYESYCPGCIELDRTQFKNVINVLNPYLDIKTYPFGNAQMIVRNGQVEFICQHGPGECYGNKLHVCALKHISNHTEALLFNICMMEPNNKTRGSDDPAVAKCASAMNVNKGPILQCAKGEEGNQLLKYYGDKSMEANFQYVPFVLINGVEWKSHDLMHDVCEAFENPPEACQQYRYIPSKDSFASRLASLRCVKTES